MRHLLPHSWIKPLARLGYASRGAIYLIIGGVTTFAFYGASDEADTKGAIGELLESPGGRVLTYLLLAGLVGYVMWRLIQSVLDTDDHGFGLKGIAVRGGLLASAITYSTLCIYTVSQLGWIDAARGGDGSTPVADAIAGVIGREWTLAGLAIVFAGVAIAHWSKAVRRRYIDHFDCDEWLHKFIHPVSIAGLTARGLVFAGVSFLLARRVWTGDEASLETPGLAAVLGYLSSLPGGRWWLAIMGVGLLLFAGYSLLQAAFRRINSEDAKGAAEQAS